MPRPPRLQKRRHRFYLRAAVPHEVQSAVGKTEVIRSLETADYREALRRLPLASAEVDAEFAEARRRLQSSPATSLSEHDARQMVLRWLWRDERRLAEREFAADRSRGLPQEQAIVENLEVLGHLSDTEDPRTLAAVQEVVRDILRQNNVRIEVGSPAWCGLCDMVHRGLVEQTRRVVDRLSGDHGTSHDPLFRSVDRESAEPEPPTRAVPTLEELVGMFLTDPTRDAGAKADDDYRLVLRFLSEFVDPGTPVSHVTRDHCRQVAALLKRFPSNANKRRALRGRRPLRAASEAERLGLPLMSRTTANGYISTMSALFRWAAREGLVDRNMAEGLLLPETIHKRDARRPLSVEQLNTILGSDVFMEPRATWDHRQWVFLLGLYAGLRLNEACTLSELLGGVSRACDGDESAIRRVLSQLVASGRIAQTPDPEMRARLDALERAGVLSRTRSTRRTTPVVYAISSRYAETLRALRDLVEREVQEQS